MADLRIAAVLVIAAAAAGCRQDMHDQPRFEPLQRSDFFSDGRSARPQVAGTIARGQLEPAKVDITDNTVPIAVSRQTLERGRERFDIYCSPCHDRLGEGDGMIARRGFRAPPSLHSERSRALPAGYVFNVITHGYGAMPAYGPDISRDDRWAIVAYIRVLQFSRNATATDVPPGETVQ